MSSRSAGHRKLPGWARSIISRLSAVYRPVGTKGGGFGESVGMSAKGSPTMLRTMRNLLGKSVITGRVLSAMGLYFRFAANVETCSSAELVFGIGTSKVGDVEIECPRD